MILNGEGADVEFVKATIDSMKNSGSYGDIVAPARTLLGLTVASIQ